MAQLSLIMTSPRHTVFRAEGIVLLIYAGFTAISSKGVIYYLQYGIVVGEFSYNHIVMLWGTPCHILSQCMLGGMIEATLLIPISRFLGGDLLRKCFHLMLMDDCV